MIGAAIGFHHREMVCPIFLVILGVLLGTAETVLFVHPRDHANCAFRFQMKLLNHVRHFH